MGLSFKKLGRGIKKIAKKNKGGFGRLVKKVGPGLVLGAVTGGVGAGLIAKAASTAKTLGKKVKGLETPKSLVPVVRAAEMRQRRKSVRTRMPGGAPMPNIPAVKVRSITKATDTSAKRSLYRSANPKTAQGRKLMRDGGIAMPGRKSRKTKRSGPRKPPSAAQLAAREKFKKMVAARRKAA